LDLICWEDGQQHNYHASSFPSALATGGCHGSAKSTPFGAGELCLRFFSSFVFSIFLIFRHWFAHGATRFV
jgi:hypothetical protein